MSLNYDLTIFGVVNRVKTINEIVETFNNYIDRNGLNCCPVNKNIVACWTCKDKKAKKYHFVSVKKVYIK